MKEFPSEKFSKNNEGPNIKSIEEMKYLHKPFNKSNQYENKLNSFIHFLKSLLCIDPNKRLTAKTALKHPFITNEKFSGISLFKKTIAFQFPEKATFLINLILQFYQKTLNFTTL